MVHVIPTDTCFGFACNIYDEKGYNQIYKMKGRAFHKQLPILVKTFDDLANILDLNTKQIEFLKKYKYPFTILAKPNKNFIYPAFLDKDKYFKFVFRVGEMFIKPDILDTLDYPLFLTSANISGTPEIYDSSKILKEFADFKENLYILEGKIEPKKPSNIFEFIEETTNVNFIRKNY